ncbi:MAG TPA: ADOP family duplicated permease [Longimicrobiales bacterium]|nr:ADOP family duplicated permease [Longimicrobiales bacterium]
MDPGNERKAVLSHAAWLEWRGGAPDVIGRDIRLDGRPYEIVGVLPEGFELPDGDRPRLYVPLALGPEARELRNWHSNSFSMVARLAPGATAEQAAAQNAALNDALIDSWALPNARQLLEDVGYHTVVVSMADDLVRDVRPLLYLLWGGVAFVLLIGCVNVANLVLARSETRVTELATRLALGASKQRVATVVLTESAVLALLGGMLGIGVGALGLRLLEVVGATDLPRGADIGIDPQVVAFGLVLALAAGVLFGITPLASILRGDLSPAFRAGGRTGTATRRSVALRNALVTAQVALAFVLVVGAGLMLVSFRAALAVDPGFDPRGVVTGYVSLPSARYDGDEAQRQLWDELLAGVRALPGVEAAALDTQLPFTGTNSSSVITPEGYRYAPGESLFSPRQSWVSPGYFDAMGIEVIAGRDFTDGDGPDAVRAIVIDEWLARRFWPDESPLGRRMARDVPDASPVAGDSLYTIAGVVETIRHDDLTTPAGEHVGAYYMTYRQEPPQSVSLVVKVASGDAAAVVPALRQVLSGLDPELPLFEVRTMEQRVADSLVSRRVPLLLLGVFGAVALFLASVGIYGALAYTVTQRQREIGIRIALGSAPERIFRTVVGQGLRVTALGLVLGGAAALLLGRVAQSLLLGVQATDPRVLAATALVLAAVAALACALPARRATRVDPIEALGA